MKSGRLIACVLALMAPGLWAQAAAKDSPDPGQVADLVLADHILAN
jgi:hypothetical protein